MIKYRICKKCGDRFFLYCRKCKREIDRVYSRKYREKNPKWKKEDNKRNSDLVKKLVNEYHRKFPDRVKAISILNVSIEKKIIKRGACIICGMKKVDGHHTDYTKPLKIIWLCHKHHKQLHAGIIKVGVVKKEK